MECTARAWQHNHVPEEEDLSGYTVGGLMVVPGTQVHKVVEVFENHFG
jgi:hypothetical protein